MRRRSCSLSESWPQKWCTSLRTRNVPRLDGWLRPWCLAVAGAWQLVIAARWHSGLPLFLYPGAAAVPVGGFFDIFTEGFTNHGLAESAFDYFGLVLLLVLGAAGIREGVRSRIPAGERWALVGATAGMLLLPTIQLSGHTGFARATFELHLLALLALANRQRRANDVLAATSLGYYGLTAFADAALVR